MGAVVTIVFVAVFILAAVSGWREKRNRLDADRYLAEKYRQGR